MDQKGGTLLAELAVSVFLISPLWSVSSGLEVLLSGQPLQISSDFSSILHFSCPQHVSLQCKTGLVRSKLRSNSQPQLLWSTVNGTNLVKGTPGQLSLSVAIAARSDVSKFLCQMRIDGLLREWIQIIVQVNPAQWSSWSSCLPACGQHRHSDRERSCCQIETDNCRKDVETRPCVPRICPADGKDKQSFADLVGPWTTWSSCLKGVHSRTRPCKAHPAKCRALPLVAKRPCRKPYSRVYTVESTLWPAVKVHEVVKRSSGSGLWKPWTPWSACDSHHLQIRTRACRVQKDICLASGSDSDSRLCGLPVTHPTAAVKTTAVTMHVLTSLASTKPSTITAGHVTHHVITSPSRQIQSTPHRSRHYSSTSKSLQHHPTTKSLHHHPVTSPLHQSTAKSITGALTIHTSASRQGEQEKQSTRSRTDSYNLRVTVAVSSGLVGSLLLVAVVACWRRLHLEQLEQQRQLLQPEATQPEYHGLQQQGLFQQAPPPTYHDAFQLDVTRVQEVQQNTTGNSSSNSQQPTNNSSAAAAASRSSSLSSSPPRGSSEQGSSTPGSGHANEAPGPAETAVSHKVTTDYMLSRLKAGMTEDEMPLEDDDVLSQSDSLPLI